MIFGKEKSQLFYHFNGSKIESIHTSTACLLKKLIFCLFVFIIVNRTRPHMWKRQWRPSRMWKSPTRPNHWKSTVTSCRSVDSPNFQTNKMVKPVANFRWTSLPKINFSVALPGQIYSKIRTSPHLKLIRIQRYQIFRFSDSQFVIERAKSRNLSVA